MDEKAYMTLVEAAQYLDMKRATLYNYMADLQITPTKFRRDRRKYLALAEVKRIKAYKERPWTEEDTGKRPVVGKDAA